ncbi:NAD(P)-dependent dehydrogenase (short-subunit alcohol dehydrogenase family) [Psychromicrobium silvestre]|uniref:NAD(P)-dependent dehydrogenase (Short-subunit alcohol dehydrogenase family) n=1 Tax=Psychromicrobium silvestre TaxID=1645614 RepID=A0A7Y9S6E4_9MICC|nr:SDR family oxidoreductase [Psychromicrobium silvestre]NYE94955.1 NAD(P)-dependent dehydrogenase (short-subunit alcohol dehydrogenase family) [Psychromicrobium silvestre]
MNPRFTKQKVLVAGAGSGLGRAIALAFATEGARLALLGRTERTLQQTLEALPGEGHVIQTADITDASGISSAVAELTTRLSGLDIAINTAGALLQPSKFGDIDPLRAAQLFTTNVLGTWNVMSAELQQMRPAGAGVIINFSSTIGAHRTMPGFAAYGASKAAVSAMSRAAALDHIAEGIRIAVISPGSSDTEMSFRAGEDETQRAARVARTNPSGRLASLDEISAATLFLASPASGYTVGADLVIDGGTSA